MFSFLLSNFVAAFLIVPGNLLFLMFLGFLVRRRYPVWGRLLRYGSPILLYLLSLPILSHYLITQLEQPTHAPQAIKNASAIIVLGGGRSFASPEFNGNDAVSVATLPRLRYAAQLHRQSGLPLLTTGGAPDGGGAPEGALMADSLDQDFGVSVRWVEDASANTYENARFSYALLANTHITTVYLVTHAWHMPRAQRTFEAAGFVVIPAPVAFTTRNQITILDFMPSGGALRDSAIFSHEIIGALWYRMRALLSPR